MNISPKDKMVFSFIKDYFRQHGKAPTVEEIRKALGFNFPTSVQRSIVSLEQKGYITKEDKKRRSIKISELSSTVEVPLVGSVACGTPLLAVENIEGYIPTDTSFIKGNTKEYFYLRANGDSMDLVGIDNGDLLLVHSQRSANNGEKIVALIDDSATVKVLKKGENYVALEPRSKNPTHKPIILREDFIIQGTVVMVFKS